MAIPEIYIVVKVINGRVICDPDPCPASIGDIIELTSAEPFAIQFLTDTPFNGHSFRSKILNGKQKVRQTVKPSAVRGVHRYACAIFSGSEVYLEANCPAIIIE